MSAKTLTYVHWYCRDAVYLGDSLVYWGECGREWGLLLAIGYKCVGYDEVPTHDIPPEFDRAENGWWEPPNSLAVLAVQFAAWRRRRRVERIAILERELADLKECRTSAAAGS